MPRPIPSAPHASPPPPAAPVREPSPSPRIGDTGRAPSPAGPTFRERLAEAAASLGASERAMDAAVARVARRGEIGMQELVAFQALVYRHSLAVDVASRVVEKATSALRQTLQSQQG